MTPLRVAALGLALLPAGVGGEEAPAEYPPELWARALAEAGHAADYVRILDDGPAELWDAAALGVLGEKGRVDTYVLPVVLDRFDALGPDARDAIAMALAAHAPDPRAVPLLLRFVRDPWPGADPKLREQALDTLLHRAGAEDVEALAALLEDGDPGVRVRAVRALASLDDPRVGARLHAVVGNEREPAIREAAVAALAARRLAAEGEPRRGELEAPRALAAARSLPLIVLLLASLWLGFVCFLWGLRLLRLRRLVRGLPLSSARAVAVGQVALRGEAQPLEGRSLRHPVTGEVCLHHEGARDARFLLVDATGSVVVDANGAVLASADGVIVPGERIQVIGDARRGRPGHGDEGGVVSVAAPPEGRSAFQRTSQLLVGAVMGRLAGGGSARMLFSDPLRCYWIWDDLQRPPFSSSRDTVWLAGSFVLAGGWLVVFLATAASLLR